MTDKDIVKDLVKEVLQENPELVRQRGIAADRAKMDAYIRQVSAPQPRSPVEAYDSPVRQVDTELPVRSVFFNDPAPGGGEPGSAPIAFTLVPTLVCQDDGTVALVNIMTQP